ncbi:MAG: GGDEF domain-containing protein [Ectothiorhodospiraceae bacterium]|nr:GGDEF domain-containing protein [Chromatiales bacterium]MCP5153554.1 GGDEF domain-containing protein [Ectothiorhodospiraceae bacterium]
MARERASADGSRNEKDWRERYLSCLDEIEEKERRWAEAEKTLLGCVSRLALTGYGDDAEVDARLDALRAAVRSGAQPNRLADLIEDVQSAVDTAERREETPPPSVVEAPPAAVAATPEPTTTPEPAARRVPERAPAAEVVAAEEPEPPPRRAGRSFLSRLLPRAGHTDDDRVVNLVLREMLDRIEFPDGLAGEVDAIVQALERPLQGKAALAMAQRVADLMVAVRRALAKERDAIEAFLGQVTERLGELDEFIGRVREGHQDSRCAGDALRESVAGDIVGLTAAMDSSDSFEALKATVTERLSHIESRLTQFLQAEAERNAESSRELERLSQRLRDSETVAAKLRQHLDVQRQRAMHDALTGLYNRRALDERLAEEHARHLRHGGGLAVLVLDVDHFKRINDQFGHAAGDRVLKAVGQVLARCTRASDVVGRFGGEEFLCLLPGTNAEQALVLADKLRVRLAETRFRHRDDTVQVTVSIGVAAFTAGEAPDAVIERADVALYAAKRGGRNRCVAAGPPGAPADVAPSEPRATVH